MAAKHVAASAEAMAPDRYAVVDGAQFDNCNEALASVGLHGRSLYLEGGSDQAVAAGPFLVDVSQSAELQAMLLLTQGKPAVVFWSWPHDEMSLYRHLRGITMVSVPGDESESSDSQRQVLFRLADPRALMLVLPSLERDQWARFLGDAQQVVFDRGDGKAIELPAQMALTARPGLISLNRQQYARVMSGFEQSTRNRAISEFAPLLQANERLPPHVAQARVEQALELARAYRLTHTDSIWQFLHMYLPLDNRFEDDPALAGVRSELRTWESSEGMRLYFAALELRRLGQT